MTSGWRSRTCVCPRWSDRLRVLRPSEAARHLADEAASSVQRRKSPPVHSDRKRRGDSRRAHPCTFSAPPPLVRSSLSHAVDRLVGTVTCSAGAWYTVARLTPSATAMVLADSPLACIRCARAAFDGASALGSQVGKSIRCIRGHLGLLAESGYQRKYVHVGPRLSTGTASTCDIVVTPTPCPITLTDRQRAPPPVGNSSSSSQAGGQQTTSRRFVPQIAAARAGPYADPKAVPNQTFQFPVNVPGDVEVELHH